MQGYGQAGQAASTLGQLGGQQFGAQKEIIGLQSQLGAQQQALEQQKINQAIQDYATQQQYPIMQLGVMSNMLRGLPMQSTQTQTYAAAPNPLVQGIGTVGALGSLANIFKGSSGREGGLPSEFKPATGIKSYSVGSQVKGILYDMSPEELQDYIEQTTSPIAKNLAKEVLRNKVGKASGGIIAFQNLNEENNQGVVKEDPDAVRQAYIDAAKMKAAADKADVDAENQRLLGRSPAPKTPLAPTLAVPPAPTLAAPLAPSGVRVGRAGVPIMPVDSPRMRAARAAEAFKGYRPSAEELAIFAEQEKNLAASRAATPLIGKGVTTIPGTTTVTNVPQDPASAGAPPLPAGIKAAPLPGGTAAASAAAPDTKSGLPTTGNPKLDAYFAKVLDDIDKPQPTIEQTIAKRKAYIGEDEYTPKERARLMAAKSNIQDEKYREFNMNAAIFFADMATRPGSIATAALTALKNTLPTFIASDKEKGKLFREIDKSLVELNKAARLEKAGEYDSARAIVEAESKKLHERIAQPIAFAKAVQAARINKEGKIKAATIGASATSDLKERDFRRKVEEGIAKERAKQDYQDLLKLASMPVNEKSSQNLKDRVAKAKIDLEAINARHEERRKTAGLLSSSSSDTSIAKPAPGGGLTQNKDGTFTYTPKT